MNQPDWPALGDLLREIRKVTCYLTNLSMFARYFLYEEARMLDDGCPNVRSDE